MGFFVLIIDADLQDPPEILGDMVQELEKNNAIKIEFQGGEPTLRTDILSKIIKWISEKFDDREFVIHKSDEESFEDIEDTSVSGSILEKSLMDLDDEFKNIIILRDIQELSYDEISKILQIPLGTVKSRINRGRLKLKGIIKQNASTRKHYKDI